MSSSPIKLTIIEVFFGTFIEIFRSMDWVGICILINMDRRSCIIALKVTGISEKGPGCQIRSIIFWITLSFGIFRISVENSYGNYYDGTNDPLTRYLHQRNT
jgi:hypothetical protein